METPRYLDYYHAMSYSDFTAWVAAGMPRTHTISQAEATK